MSDGAKNGVVSHAQLARLFRIVLHLQAGGFPRADDLAGLCGVSRRTTYRDLETLARAGLPLRYRADRMGYELDSAFWMTPVALREEEAVALIAHVCVGDREIPHSVGLLAMDALRKLVSVQPPTRRDRCVSVLDGLWDRRVRSRASPPVAHVFEVLLGAISRGRRVRLQYREPTAERDGKTELLQCLVHPYRLVRHGRGWSLVGRSSVERRRRSFRLEVIQDVQELDEPAQLPARLRLRKGNSGVACD